MYLTQVNTFLLDLHLWNPAVCTIWTTCTEMLLSVWPSFFRIVSVVILHFFSFFSWTIAAVIFDCLQCPIRFSTCKTSCIFEYHVVLTTRSWGHRYFLLAILKDFSFHTVQLQVVKEYMFQLWLVTNNSRRHIISSVTLIETAVRKISVYLVYSRKVWTIWTSVKPLISDRVSYFTVDIDDFRNTILQKI